MARFGGDYVISFNEERTILEPKKLEYQLSRDVILDISALPGSRNFWIVTLKPGRVGFWTSLSWIVVVVEGSKEDCFKFVEAKGVQALLDMFQ